MSNLLKTITVNKRQDYKAVSQKKQMIRQLEVRVKKDWFENTEIFKATRRNMAKRLKMRKILITTRIGKTVKSATKQIAMQELLIVKTQIEEWKKKVMREMA